MTTSRWLTFFFSFIFFAFFLFCKVTPVSAVSYSLTAPSGQLTRGQPVSFTINIDTEGQALSNATIGMTYKSDILQYVSTTPGNTFSSVTASPDATNGQIIFTAQNGTPFTGTGTFATVTFNLVAQAAGSTQLCVLFNPGTTPSPPPQGPQPTALPKTGGSTLGTKSTALGGIFILLAAGLFVSSKFPQKKSHKNLH